MSPSDPGGTAAAFTARRSYALVPVGGRRPLLLGAERVREPRVREPRAVEEDAGEKETGNGRGEILQGPMRRVRDVAVNAEAERPEGGGLVDDEAGSDETRSEGTRRLVPRARDDRDPRLETALDRRFVRQASDHLVGRGRSAAGDPCRYRSGRRSVFDHASRPISAIPVKFR